MAISDTPFSGDPVGDKNRIHRITMSIGGVKVAAHVVHPTGSKSRYDRARDDAVDPDNIQTPERNTYITEES